MKAVQPFDTKRRMTRQTQLFAAGGKISNLRENQHRGERDCQKNIFNIGKEKENDFTIINNKAVSRRHAVIERINGTYYLMDKGSTNHTYLNGEMLDAENSYVLSDHDSIQIADEEFTFYFD